MVADLKTESWERQLSNHIRQYRASKGPEYRNKYGAIISDAVQAKRITAEESTLLKQVVPVLEAWIGDSPPEPSEALAQWEQIYRAEGARLPDSVLEALLRRFPKAEQGTLNWDAYLLDGAVRWVVDALLDRHLIRSEDFVRLAKAEPDHLYRSAALDVLLERGTALPRPLWDVLAKAAPRPAGMMPLDEVLLHAHANDRSEDADKRMLAILEAHPEHRASFLSGLLSNQDAALRFVRMLLSGPSSAKKRDAETKSQLLGAWVLLCNDALAAGGATAPTAALIIGQARLAAQAEPKGIQRATLEQATAAAGDGVRLAALRALQRAEHGTAGADSEFVFVLRAEDLYSVLQEYLRTLPVGTSTGQESPERALRYERHVGSKMVLDQVIAALDDVPGETELHDAVEVALFNSGVRPLGRVGERVSFDVHAHRATEAGVFPGDAVVIVEQGRVLGEADNRMVLVKAKVRREG